MENKDKYIKHLENKIEDLNRLVAAAGERANYFRKLWERNQALSELEKARLDFVSVSDLAKDLMKDIEKPVKK